MNDISITKNNSNESNWLIDKISETTKNIRKIHTLYIGLLFYCLLTVVTIMDRQLVLNELIRLPIFNINVSLNGFFFIAPVMLLVMFIYFQIHLNELKELTDRLKLEYPNDKEKIYPWIFNSSDDQRTGFISRIRYIIIQFSLWLATPLFLCTNAFMFIKKHDKTWNIIIVFILPIIGIIIVLLFWKYYKYSNYNFKLKKRFGGVKNNKTAFLLIVLFIIFEIFFCVSISLSFKGVKIIKSWSWPCVDLSYQKLIIEENEDYETLYWVDLKNKHLEGANLTNSILKRADLQNVYLKNAILRYTDLREALLDNAKLQNADLWHVQLENASLKSAILNGAILCRANLKKANLSNSSLAKTKLNGAQLNDADFRNAITEDVDLRPIYFDSSKFSATNLDSASYVSIFPYNIFEDKDSFEVNFKSDKFIRTDLRGIKNLTIEQLKAANSPQMALLDSSKKEEMTKIQFSNVDSIATIDQNTSK